MSDSAPLSFVSPGGADLVFSANPLDRSEALRMDEAELLHKLLQPAAQIVLFDSEKALMTVEPDLDLAIFRGDSVPDSIKQQAPWVFLGIGDGRAWFALDVTGMPAGELPAAASDAHKFIDLRSIAIGFGDAATDSGRAAILAEGKSLLEWHRRHRFCSMCGGATESRQGGFLRRCMESACAAEHFPRTDPVVIMLILAGDECLVGRQPQFLDGVYSALAGFMEPGESIEEAVRREVLEETNIRVGEVRYFASQPWPFPSSLMIGCFGEALSREITIDPRELEDACWVERQVVGEILKGEDRSLRVPPAMAIAHQLLRHWADPDD